MTTAAPATDCGIRLQPDARRVIIRFFVPGREDVGPGDSRASTVIERILQLDETSVEAIMLEVDQRFDLRHECLHESFLEHGELATLRLHDTTRFSLARRLLVGAAFTHEYAIEAAALCNPSAVLFPHHDESLTTGDAQFVMSVRGIGEGHRSSIGFRTGTISSAGSVTVDPPGPYPIIAAATPGPNYRSSFHAQLDELDDDNENAAYVLDALPSRFDDADLSIQIDALNADGATRRNTAATISNLIELAQSSYRVEFPEHSELSERVLFPHAPAESQGMEDARFVRFVHDDGTHVYYATYTAFDGTHINQHLLETKDFLTFFATSIAGAAAIGKGLAIFPRKLNGQYLALSRADRETNAIAFSDDLRRWDTSLPLQSPIQSWEILQLGNCGSPIETESGWLVITHGVGAMRTYSIGAILLHLDEPQRVIGFCAMPLITPDEEWRDGYVPNVVYSCGGFAHGDTLVLPYGIADQSIAIATFSITEIINSMTAVSA